MSKKELKQDTEKQILEAAHKVFVKNGFSGTRMQEIADEAKINKSLLHYYYRSKDKLFSSVFQLASQKFMPDITKIFNNETTLFEFIEIFIREYIKTIQNNPYIPMFVLHELSKNPENMVNSFFSIINNFNPVEKFNKLVQIEIEKGTIRYNTKAKHLFTNILSMCVFPFLSRPLLQKIGFSESKKKYDVFLKERTTEITQFVFNSIKI